MTLDTAGDESRKKMAHSVTWSPAQLFSRDGKLCYYGRLEYNFFAFVPCFRYVFLLRVPSSVQQSSATLSKHVVRDVLCLLASLVACLISEFLCCYLFSTFVVLISQVFLCAPVHATLAFDLPILILSLLWFFSVSL